MIICDTAAEAVADVADGATVLVGGFGMAGMPVALIDALIEQGATDLTVVSNNAGNGDTGLAALLAQGRVRKVVCSFPRQVDSWVFDRLYRERAIELDLVPQGNLAERLRAAVRGSARSSVRRRSARCWPRVARRARSTGGPTCWSTPSAATSP